jgi:diadenosine tetraphosphate (Ap4A) HIT family hydrolase
MRKATVDVPNAAGAPRGDYDKVLEKIVEEGHCPFCREHLFKYHTNPVLVEGSHWLVTRNFRPYKGSVHHFLVISLAHIERIEEMSKGAENELFDHYRWLCREYDLSGATIVFRSGDTDLTSATVSHLHFQVITGDRRGDNTEFLRAPVGFRVKS